MKNQLRVGVFDSGIGGLTVLHACTLRLPAASYFYFGDNAHAPYGSRPPEEIVRLVRAALLRFERLGVDAAVLACNTATAVCADLLRGQFAFPIVGLEPAVLPAARALPPGGRILVLATPRTAQSERLARLCRLCRREVTVCPLPGLAAEIERAALCSARADLSALPKGEFGAVVLGCTHYVFVKERIAAFYGAPVFDGNDGAARRLKAILTKSDEKAGKIDHDCLVLNSNISSQKMTKTDIKFLGSNGFFNKSVYKRMFIFNNSKNFGKL